MAEGFIFFAAVLLQGFLCARLLPHKYNYMEKGILAGAAEIAEIAVAANLLAVLGMFSLYALSAVLFVSAGICLWIVCKREKVQEASGKMSRWDVAAVALLLISFCLCFFFPTKYMPAGRDPGVYLINGVHIAKTGGITYESNVYLNEHYEEVKDLLKLDAPGFYSEYEYGISKEPGSVVTQFLHMFPSMLAVGYRVGGLEGLVRVNAFINFFALGIMYLLTKRMFGEKAAGLALLFLTVNPAQLWAGRITQTELLSQMLLFLGIYWFYEGWETEKLRYAGYAGLLFGISTFNRIDAYIIGVGILVMWGYCEWFEVKKKYARVAAGLYLILGAAALGYGFIFSYPYYKVHLHKGLAMIVGINVVLAVLVLLVGAILSIQRKSIQRNSVQTGQESDSPEKIREFVQGRGSVLLSVLLGVLALFAYLLRPVLLKNYEEPVNLYAMQQFCWYVTIPAMILLFYGFYRILHRNQEWERYLLFLAIGFSNLIAYIVRPSISPDHIWMSRRWIFVCIPFVLMMAAYGISRLPWSGKNRRGKSVVQGGLALLITGMLLIRSTAFLTEKMYGGMDEQYEKAAEQLEDDKIYLTTNTSLAGSYRFLYGKNVFLLKDMRGELQKYLQDREVYYIGNVGELDLFHVQAEELSEQIIQGTFLEKTTEHFPRALDTEEMNTSVYRLRAADQTEIEIPMSLFTIAAGSTRTGNVIETEEAGYAFWGPYMKLEQGHYRVVFSIDTAEETNGKCEIAMGGNLLAEKEIAGNKEVELEFDVEGAEEGIEFRVQTEGGSLRCDSVHLWKQE